MKRNVANAMMASLGVTELEKVSNVTIDKHDSQISKYAGLYVSNPTYENLEDFLRRYILNELSFFPRVLDVSIEILPSSMDSSNKEHIEEASGVVSIKLHQKKIELPFIFRDGQVLPFDVIQMDGQRVPFSRENLMKLIVNLDKKISQGDKGVVGEGAYLDTEKPINPSTAAGFMSDVIQIRDGYVNRHGNMYVSASGDNIDLDSMLEKLASLSPMTQEQKEVIALVLNKKAEKDSNKEFEKIASEAEKIQPTKAELKEFKKAENVRFVDIKSITHGRSVIYPEVKANELSMKPAIVLSDIDKSISGKYSKIIVSNDGEFKIINDQEKFLCVEAPGAAFTIPTTELRGLEEGDKFFALKGNSVVGPFKLSDIRTFGKGIRYGDNEETHASKFTAMNVIPLDAGNNREVFAKATPILLVPGHKFDTVKFDDVVTYLSKNSELDTDAVRMVLPYYAVTKGANEKNNKNGVVICSDPHTKVFKLNNEIIDFIKSKNEFDSFYKLAETGYNLMEKTAAPTENVLIECVDRKQKLYNLTINYRDTDKRIMNARRQYLNRINEGKLKAILYTLKFQSNTISEMMFKARNEPRAMYPLPATCTVADINKINGGKLVNISSQNVQKTVNKLFDPLNLATNLTTTAITGLAVDSLSGFAHTQKGFEVFNALRKIAGTSQALSCYFEKTAIENESEEYLDYAKLMTIGYHLADKTATILHDDKNV
ncbi:MAG: hypothetical protein ACRC0V_09370, partial [Fusobacteriaceae bacterium]